MWHDSFKRLGAKLVGSFLQIYEMYSNSGSCWPHRDFSPFEIAEPLLQPKDWRASKTTHLPDVLFDREGALPLRTACTSGSTAITEEYLSGVISFQECCLLAPRRAVNDLGTSHWSSCIFWEGFSMVDLDKPEGLKTIPQGFSFWSFHPRARYSCKRSHIRGMSFHDQHWSFESTNRYWCSYCEFTAGIRSAPIRGVIESA